MRLSVLKLGKSQADWEESFTLHNPGELCGQDFMGVPCVPARSLAIAERTRGGYRAKNG